MKGVQCQTSVMISEIIATSGEVSQPTAGRPTSESSQLSGPICDWNMMLHITPTIAGVMTIGVSSAARSMFWPRISRCTKSAIARPRTSSIVVAETVKTSDRTIESRKG